MRIRTIKPEFYRSEDIKRLPREVRLLFIGLWSYVDDNGVGIDDHRLITADLFPLEDDQNEVREYVREGLATLSRGLQITRYAADGKRYLFVTNWDKHQRIDKPAKTRYPRPSESSTSQNTEGSPEEAENSRDSREGLAPGTEEQRNRGTEKKTSSSSSEPAPRPDVDQLCERLRDRAKANGANPAITKAWRTAARRLLDLDGRELDQALRLVDWATSHHFWSAHVLAMPKFRQKYDQLLIQARNEQRQRQQSQQSQTDANIARLLGGSSGGGGLPNLRALPGGA